MRETTPAVKPKARHRLYEPTCFARIALLWKALIGSASHFSTWCIAAVLTMNVAEWARRAVATVAYVSTDYAFDGKKGCPYRENDFPAPLNAYGITKLAGGHFTAAIAPKSFVLRVSAIYGHQPCRAKGGLNFVELMLKLSRERDELRVVDDAFVTPTPTVQIAEQLVALSRSTHYGLYHGTAEGSCSWYEFAHEIFRATGTKIRLEKARPGEFPAKVPRPKYSVLENHALKATQLNVLLTGGMDWIDISVPAHKIGCSAVTIERGSPAV